MAMASGREDLPHRQLADFNNSLTADTLVVFDDHNKSVPDMFAHRDILRGWSLFFDAYTNFVKENSNHQAMEQEDDDVSEEYTFIDGQEENESESEHGGESEAASLRKTLKFPYRIDVQHITDDQELFRRFLLFQYTRRPDDLNLDLSRFFTCIALDHNAERSGYRPPRGEDGAGGLFEAAVYWFKKMHWIVDDQWHCRYPLQAKQRAKAKTYRLPWSPADAPIPIYCSECNTDIQGGEPALVTHLAAHRVAEHFFLSLAIPPLWILAAQNIDMTYDARSLRKRVNEILFKTRPDITPTSLKQMVSMVCWFVQEARRVSVGFADLEAWRAAVASRVWCRMNGDKDCEIIEGVGGLTESGSVVYIRQ
ncbi:uncharacterized protein EV422DRAFT_599080 [Fimicolochytrium jonesii]|uniref:uncharacterized protein n=1 Tax=Fimicolochytrium jonesii TaxID=1396493 RepID=UPI0022FEACB8|nr:uncharacterized protein EV422DRAFT_599080 [Fimicolochytrium jonesii]KAI8819135.1 hypothetical protein EV422DRAFT_599080 [Fimicolochytrium jonesii]